MQTLQQRALSMFSLAMQEFFRTLLRTFPSLLVLAIASMAVAQPVECDDESNDSAAKQSARASLTGPESMKSFRVKPIARLICDIKDFPQPEPADDESPNDDATDAEERQVRVNPAMLWQGNSNVIRTSDEFAQWWKKAPWKKNQKPEVDFEKSILLIYAYNSGNTSLRGGWQVLVIPDGNFGVVANYMTKEVWQPTNQYRVLFFAVPKQEVEEYIESVQQAKVWRGLPWATVRSALVMR